MRADLPGVFALGGIVRLCIAGGRGNEEDVTCSHMDMIDDVSTESRRCKCGHREPGLSEPTREPSLRDGLQALGWLP